MGRRGLWQTGYTHLTSQIAYIFSLKWNQSSGMLAICYVSPPDQVIATARVGMCPLWWRTLVVWVRWPVAARTPSLWHRMDILCGPLEEGTMVCWQMTWELQSQKPCTKCNWFEKKPFMKNTQKLHSIIRGAEISWASGMWYCCSDMTHPCR